MNPFRPTPTTAELREEGDGKKWAKVVHRPDDRPRLYVDNPCRRSPLGEGGEGGLEDNHMPGGRRPKGPGERGPTTHCREDGKGFYFPECLGPLQKRGTCKTDRELFNAIQKDILNIL